MTRTVMVRNLVAVAAITIVSVGLSGCDYWPPALQTQIEQLRSELQSATSGKGSVTESIRLLCEGERRFAGASE